MSNSDKHFFFSFFSTSGGAGGSEADGSTAAGSAGGMCGGVGSAGGIGCALLVVLDGTSFEPDDGRPVLPRLTGVCGALWLSSKASGREALFIPSSSMTVPAI